ncbi:hypothetical protein Prubr_19470 [Polymorphospora rubra]|uniref:Uncharacterized protein n=1 Tax=Polymorphospora rubra TaxID=338584 RepID=A0A810MUP5_9ACTN|nr:hypothetical protein Prubr_19470 [Polymorphospora rubra]
MRLREPVDSLAQATRRRGDVDGIVLLRAAEVRRKLGRNRLVGFGEQMTVARSNTPADPMALMSAKA